MYNQENQLHHPYQGYNVAKTLVFNKRNCVLLYSYKVKYTLVIHETCNIPLMLNQNIRASSLVTLENYEMLLQSNLQLNAAKQ